MSRSGFYQLSDPQAQKMAVAHCCTTTEVSGKPSAAGYRCLYGNGYLRYILNQSLLHFPRVNDTSGYPTGTPLQIVQAVCSDLPASIWILILCRTLTTLP